MRTAPRLVLLCGLFLAGLFLACGGDDDDDDSDGTTTPTPTASRLTSTPRPTDSDEKSPGPGESPDGGETPVDTATPPPTGTGGTPAPRIEDVAAFFSQFPSQPQDERLCAYNPSTRLIDCSDRGVYAPDPPPVGQDIQCFLMVSGGNSVVVRCEIAEPQGTAYYDVRG